MGRSVICFIFNLFYYHLVLQRSHLEECTVFIESLKGQYNMYLSRHYAHLGWYVGLKRSGKVKKGSKTGHNQKACKFLPRRTNFQ